MDSLRSKHSLKIKIIAAALSVFLIVSVGAVKTYSWLTARDTPIVNTFQKGLVSCNVEESFDGSVKKNVQIRNTGNVDAYIRVALIPAWKEGENLAAYSGSLDQCNVTWGSTYNEDWFIGTDGFYYCRRIVAPDALTPVLIQSCSIKTNVGSLSFELQVLASAIQAVPASTVASLWPVNVDSNNRLAEK